jgi:hypothetical protein
MVAPERSFKVNTFPDASTDWTFPITVGGVPGGRIRVPAGPGMVAGWLTHAVSDVAAVVVAEAPDINTPAPVALVTRTTPAAPRMRRGLFQRCNGGLSEVSLLVVFNLAPLF